MPLHRIGGVVVIDEKLGLRCDFVSDAKRLIDVVRTGNQEPGAVTESVWSAGVDHFVDDVPRVDVVAITPLKWRFRMSACRPAMSLGPIAAPTGKYLASAWYKDGTANPSSVVSVGAGAKSWS